MVGRDGSGVGGEEDLRVFAERQEQTTLKTDKSTNENPHPWTLVTQNEQREKHG